MIIFSFYFLVTIIMNLTTLLSFAVKQNASDVHLSAGLPPMMRIDGDICRMDHPSHSHDDVLALLSECMNDFQRQSLVENLEIDFSITLDNVSRFRVNAYHQRRGVSAAFRMIPSDIQSLEELELGQVFRDICNKKNGLILVTGPTGQGKSTTLASMIDYINRTRSEHILTVEDPIEFVHESKKSLINQREFGTHTLSFEHALRSALREDPDILLIGEMRDLETIRLALTAAETGHLVFATLHTNSAAKTIDRIINVFPGEEQAVIRGMLSESLQAVISQTLVKKIGGGRVCAHEIMLGVPAICNLIREEKIAQMHSVIQTGQRQGMKTLDQCLVDLIAQNIITREAALTKAYNQKSFE
jgi:twitching motility protein PilT